jgi:hypothetical protein
MTPVAVEVTIERKLASLPGFVVVPAPAIAAWGLTATTVVEGTLAGVPLGRRTIKRWDDDRWFVELTAPILAAAGLAVGDRARLEIAPASDELPEELAALLADPAARARWEAYTPSQQRMVREDVRAAKSPDTRRKRAERALAPREAPPVTVGPSGTVDLRVVGRDPPGRTFGCYADVSVAMQVKAAHVGIASGDVPVVEWRTRLRVEPDGDWRGEAVHGPKGERFLYLAWIGRQDGGEPAMFRRAKLQLDALTPDLRAAAVRRGTLVAELGLADACGEPICASVRPPRIRWSAG